MILVAAESTAELQWMARLIDGARHRGDDATRSALSDVRLVFIGAQPSATVATLMAGAPPMPDHGLMTRSQAARAIGRSPSTVDRYADEGKLDKVDGRITAASLTEYMRGER